MDQDSHLIYCYVNDKENYNMTDVVKKIEMNCL